MKKNMNRYHRSKVVSLSSLILILGGLFCVSGIIYAATSSSVIAPSSTTAATQPTTMQHLVRTSDGTMHAFVQQGTQTSTCDGSSKNGLVWMFSTDTGATWTCGGQLSSDITNLMYASAAKDAEDNLYVVYSMLANGGGVSNDVFYRKLTKGTGASWTLEAEDTVLDGSATVGYSYAVVEVDTTRAWVAARYFDGASYQVSTYYSSNLSADPSFTVSQEALNTVGTNTGYHMPTIVRFGTKIGVIYNAQLPTASQRWRFRADSDALTVWTPETIVSTTSVGAAYFTTIADAAGNIYHAVNTTTTIVFSYWNGSAWSLPAIATTATASGGSVSLATDGAGVFVYYVDTTGLAGGLPGMRKLVYKRGVAPYTAVDFDATATNVVSHHGIFDKYWSYNGSAYTNDTTDAGNITNADTSMTSALGSIVYFGKTEKFDAISWDVSTTSTGGTIVWEYWNGSEWTTLSFTTSSNTNFQGDGYGAFTDPSDWATTPVNSEATPYYYVRARASVAHTRAPIGVQLTSIPLINWINVWPSVVSNTVYGMWTENSGSPIRTKFAATTVAAVTPNAASMTGISPNTVGYSSLFNGTQPSTMRNIVRTTDGTIHAFIQGGNNNACGNQSGSENGMGLHWTYSTDNGATWLCGAQLSGDNVNLMYSSATADSGDNIYVVYSAIAVGASAYYDTYYRKLTKGEGATWTAGAEQKILDADGTKAYTSAVVAIEGTTRLWMAVRYFNGSAYTVSSYYSSDLSASPTWTVSQASLDTGGASSGYHYPVIVRFGEKIGVLYDAETAQVRWRFRSDSDDLTSWSVDQATGGSTTTNNTWTAVSDAAGNIYLASSYSTNIYFSNWNGFTWTPNVTVATNASTLGGVSLSTDGENVWIVYSQTTGLSAGLSGSRQLVYKKIALPYNLTELDVPATPLVSYHGVFDKYWSYNGSAYTNDTTDAGSTANADTQMTSGVGSILYFGKTEKFDVISWDVSTNGTVGQVVWEYSNDEGGWSPLTKFFGSTNTAFYGDGYLSFAAPDNWATAAVNSENPGYYYVRARTTTAYTVAPVGVQFAAIPAIYWAATVPAAASNAMLAMWTENATSPTRVRYSPITVATTTGNTAAGVDLNAVVGYSNTINATYHSLGRHIVRTSDGTIHSFVQGSTRVVCGGASSSLNNYGLFWVYSTDNGVTWTCGGQMNNDTTNVMYPSATKDAADNVYVVYSVATTGVNLNYDVFYRKLTKGAGSTWTVGDAQTVLDAASNTAYSYATIEVDSASRGWIATRYMDTNNTYQVSVYYTDSLTSAPSWTVSQTTLNTAGFSSADHLPVIVKFGSNIGVIYSAEEGSQRWRFRADTDEPTVWHAENIVSATNMGAPTFAAVGDANGNVYHAMNSGAYIYFNYWNGSVWSQNATVVNNTASSGAFVSLSTDGSNVWVFYGDTTGLTQSSYHTRKFMYKKGVLPYTAADFDAAATPVISYHGTFDKYWSYVGSSYLDDTTDSGNTTLADTRMATNVDDIMYFGKTAKYDTVEWELSTAGVGGVLAWEYWNDTAWVSINNFVTSYRPVMTGHGYVTFQPPSDWATKTVNDEATPYYYVRARVTKAFTTTPVANQLSTIPWWAWVSVDQAPVSNTIQAVWTENATVPVRTRYAPISVTTTTPNAAASSNFEIPTTIGYSALLNGTQPSTMKKMVRTSEGTLHAFVQAGTVAACGNRSDADNKVGLDWIYSTDTGLTWICGGQLSDNVTYAMHASAVVDSSDNIYVVYSMATTGSNLNYDVFYRKLVKGEGSTWTVTSAQTVLDAGSTSGYSYATLEIEDATRLWLAVRYYDNANYQISTYYSDGLTASPSWTVSQLAMETVGTSASYHYPTLVRYGTNIGVIYNGQTPASMRWRTRADTDDLTTWAAEAAVSASVVQSPTFTAVGKTDGTVYLAMNVGTSVTFTYWDGSAWSANAVVANAIAASNVFVGLTMSGANAYVYYGETTGLSAGLSGSRKIMYKKGVSPYATANFDASSTAIVAYHGVFDKYWSYYGEDYTDDTTDAGNTTSADTQLVSVVGDIAYFGKSAKFDALSWDLSTNGTGGQIAWEYWNGSSWVLITDVLGVLNPTFYGDGHLSFIPPSDWALKTVSSDGGSGYYYVRARVVTAFTVPPVAVQVAAIPQINWFTTIGNNTNLYWLWTENANAPARIKFDSFVFNVAPDLPSSLGPTGYVNGSATKTTQPALTFTITDTNRYDTERFQIQIDDTADFGSPVIDYTSGFAAKGARTFTVGQADGDGTYTTGSESQTLADGSYYWRVKATDNSSESSGFSTANGGSVAFIVDNGHPEVNATGLVMLRSAGGTAVANGTGWTKSNEPYFSWDPGSDAPGGGTILGYCLYLGTAIDGDPDGAKGMLADTSPIPVPAGCNCQFIVDTTSIDLSTVAYQGASWLTTSEDPYYFAIKAVDTVGNVYEGDASQFTFYYDFENPTNVSYISPAAGTFSNVVDMSFSWPIEGTVASSDDHADVLGWQYQLNSTLGDWEGTTKSSALDLDYIPATASSYMLTSDRDGDHIVSGSNTIYFRTVDKAGNISSNATIRTGNIAYGGSAPTFGGSDVVTITPDTNTTNSYALSWPAATAAEGLSVASYYFMTVPPPATLATLTGNYATFINNGTSRTLTASALPGVNKGTNTVYVVAVDNAANPNYSPSNFIKGTFVLDSDDPDNVVELVASDSSIKSQLRWNVALTWAEPEYKGAGNLSYLIYRSADGETYAQVGSTSGLSYVDTAPSSETYYYKVYTKDGANALSSGTNAVSILPTGRWTTAPTLETEPTVTSITTKKATITWSTSRTADSKVSFGSATNTYGSEEPSNSTQVSSHTINLTNLTPGTTYYYKAKWTDEDGNTGTSSEKSFSTDPAPTVTDPKVSTISISSAILSYTVSGASKVKIYYGKTANFGGVKEVSTATSSTTYTTSLEELEDGTKYYYKINTFDSEAAEYEGSILSFETLPKPKISTVRIQQVAGTAQSTVLVTWTTNTEVSSIVTYYPVDRPGDVRDEVNVALVKGAHRIVIRGLLPQTNYMLLVKGRDKIGNEAQSDAQKFTTATDTRPAQITDLRIEGSNVASSNGSSQESTAQFVVSWNTDEPGTSQVEFGEGTGTTYASKTQEDANMTLNHLVIISNLTPSKVYHLRALSKDKAENTGMSVDTVAIAPKATDNAFNLVITSLQSAFGFLGGLKQ